MARSLCLGALLALGCSGAEGSSTTMRDGRYEPLVELDDWQSVEREADPFVADATALPDCPTTGVRVEADQGWLELDTTACSWVTVTGLARFDVDLGQQLKLVVSHFDLDAPAPAKAQLELRLDGCKAWSQAIPIPSAADVVTAELASPCALRQNDAVWFHLQNHGQNTYQLQDVAILR
jgi:hypothetical protein